MKPANTQEKQRQRAPSKRSLETRERIFDAAEAMFAQHGFEGASLRDIATTAGVAVGLVHHHGGSKEGLFHQGVARRADMLSTLRLTALDAARRSGPLTLDQIMGCFFGPYLDLAENGGAGWRAYARLVAMVSSEERWRSISEACFDPAAATFIGEISRIFPSATQARISTSFVFCVASMLAICTSQWRIDVLGGDKSNTPPAETLQTFCCSGLRAALSV